MFTRTARKALRQSRQQVGGDYVAILKEGERAAKTNAPNPYAAGTEEFEIFEEGRAEG